MIQAPARDENHVCHRRQCYLQEASCFVCVIAYECRLRTKDLENKWPLLSSVHAVVKKAGRECEPRGWVQIVLIIDRCPLEQSAGWPDEAILVRIVQLSLVVVA